MKRVAEPNVVKGPDGQIVKVVWLPGQRVRFDIQPGPVVIEAAYLQSPKWCKVQVRYGAK